MSGVLEIVPWFVISVFAGSAILAVAAGRPKVNNDKVGDAGAATRAVGLIYAVAVAVVVALWASQQIQS